MYKVSVVTPFHNVDMGMFQKCAEGMRNQTIGFENIEWIIVVHNSKPHYLQQIVEMFKDDENVTVHMKQFTGTTPHNHGYYYTEETVYGHAVADDSDLFETISSGSFHEYLPLEQDHAATILSTSTQPGIPYQLVVTNNAGLYRYVTDHVVVIRETQIDKILFTIY